MCYSINVIAVILAIYILNSVFNGFFFKKNKLDSADTLLTIGIFGMVINSVAFGISFAFVDNVWYAVSWGMGGFSLLRGLLIVAGLFFVAKAFKMLPVSILSPLSMVIIVPLLLLSWWIFGDAVDFVVLILVGAMLAFCVTLVVLEGRKKNSAAKNSPPMEGCQALPDGVGSVVIENGELRIENDSLELVDAACVDNSLATVGADANPPAQTMQLQNQPTLSTNQPVGAAPCRPHTVATENTNAPTIKDNNSQFSTLNSQLTDNSQLNNNNSSHSPHSSFASLKKDYWRGIVFFIIAMSCFLGSQLLTRVLADSGQSMFTITFFNSGAILFFTLLIFAIFRRNPVKSLKQNLKQPLQYGIAITDSLWLFLYLPLVTAMNLGVLNATSRISTAIIVLGGIFIFKERPRLVSYFFIAGVIGIGVALAFLSS